MIDPAEYPLWNSPAMNAYLKTVSPETMLVEGRGVRVRDRGGRWLLDARSGLWNVTLGYDNQRVIAAMKQQLDTLPYANLIGYGRPSGISMEAANALLPHLPEHLTKIRYCSNGSQAVETAVLLSRFLHRVRGEPERTTVFGMWRGFHGLGAGGGALTGIPYVHYQAGPLLPGVLHGSGPFETHGDGTASGLEQAMADHGPERISAVVVEPIVGEGAHVLTEDYLRSLADFCRVNGIHLIIDEVTTGMGRTGAFTRCGQLGVRPDILTLGKGLTSGYAALSAVVLSDEIYEQVRALPYDQQFFIGSTNDGHPVALAASMAVVEVLTTDRVLDNVQRSGAELFQRLSDVAKRHPHVTAIRGTGLMYAIELSEPDLLRLAMEARGVLVSTLAKWPAIVIIPPLVVSDDEVEEIVVALDQALDEVANL
ncbi:aspartate aminotransferase family protein [Kibdelosporangium persicum]|uniref:Acetylornithine aminotransferase n=1 Tax=Kibdelosporangium persicum TaxID=2698649 RepID=A0ABX2FJW6_9PSEU|nr:aminotransferase class III-fold pyridoxal phosphate-dependent enzyme [Kibdelosporangium persicum]NRN71086.1 Acetylornithine aminotransferase [Kibdelosporangium persicum]